MSDLVGKNIGNYQVVELVDDRGRSVVYRGFQASTNRYVAIKVLKEELNQDQAAIQAFEQYAQRAAAIQNSHILPVLDTGQENGVHYLITPFYKNKSVASHMTAYGDVHQALNLIQGIIPGLEFIYSQGTVHANLKPSNIILDDQMQPLLADFGMVSLTNLPASSFNSPEQVQGGVVDQRTDVYALGMILYVLLTGKTPPTGTSINLRSQRPDLPQAVEQVILKALAPNPDQRFQTPRQFSDAFASALQPVAPQPAAPAPTPAATPAPQPTSEKSGMNWTNFILGGVVIVLLCLCVVVIGPRVIDALGGQSEEVAAEPTEVPQVEVILPTREPRDTREPVERPPEQEAPAEGGPAEEGGGSQLCTSLGFAGGFVLLGGVFSLRRKKKL
jgi:serine/threonine-protein kinase